MSYADDEKIEAKIADTIRKFWEDIADLSEQMVRGWPNGDKLVALAKIMFEHQSPYPATEHDWKRLTFGLPGGAPYYDCKKTMAWQQPVRPVWWHFLPEASAAIKFFGADVAKEQAVDFMKAVREIAKP